MGSYHDLINGIAREVESQRAQAYSEKSNELITFTELELEYLKGAEYKLSRVHLATKSPMKALDDALDAYNYVALFFRSFAARHPDALENLRKSLGLSEAAPR